MSSPDISLIKTALSCKCPQCHKGDMFAKGFSLELNSKCAACGFNFADNDVGDGAVMFLIFILGFLLVPLALVLEWLMAPPLWLHGIIWTIVALGLTVGSLKPLKSYIMALNYKHRRDI